MNHSLQTEARLPEKILCLAFVANGPYARLAYQSLAYPPGFKFESLIYSPDYVRADINPNLLKANSLVLISWVTVADRLNTEERCWRSDPLDKILPFRWAELTENARDGIFRIRLGLTAKSTGPWKESRGGNIQQQLRSCFTAADCPDHERQTRLSALGINPNHPFLVSTSDSADFERICPDYSQYPRHLSQLGKSGGLKRRPSLNSEMLTMDSERWSDVMRDINQATKDVADCKYFSESSLRIVKVEKKRLLNLRPSQSPWLPVRQSDLGDTTIYRVKRRRSHQIHLRTRKPLHSEIDDPAFALSLFRQVGSTREAPIQIVEGTLEHSLQILIGDKPVLGELAVHLSFSEQKAGQSKPRTSYLSIAMRVVGRSPAPSIVIGCGLLAFGVATESSVEFVRNLHQFKGVFTVASITSVSVAVALLTYGFSRWAPN